MPLLLPPFLQEDLARVNSAARPLGLKLLVQKYCLENMRVLRSRLLFVGFGLRGRALRTDSLWGEKGRTCGSVMRRERGK